MIFACPSCSASHFRPDAEAKAGVVVVCRRCKTRFKVTGAGVEALPPEDESPIEEAVEAAPAAEEGPAEISEAEPLDEIPTFASPVVSEAEPVEDIASEDVQEPEQPVRSGVSFVKTDDDEPQTIEATVTAFEAPVATTNLADLASSASDSGLPTFGSPFVAGAAAEDDGGTLAALGPGHDDNDEPDPSAEADYQPAGYADAYAAGPTETADVDEPDEPGTLVDGPNPFSKKATLEGSEDDYDDAPELTERRDNEIVSTSLLPSQRREPQINAPIRRSRRDTAESDSTELVGTKERRDTGVIPRDATGVRKSAVRSTDEMHTVSRPRFPSLEMGDYLRDLGRYFKNGTAGRKVIMLVIAAIPVLLVAWLIIALVRTPSPAKRWVSSPTSMWSGPAAQRGYAQVDTLVRGEELVTFGEPNADYVMVRDVWGRVGYVFRESLTDSRPNVTPDSVFPGCRAGPTENDNAICDQRAAGLNESCVSNCSSDQGCVQRCQDRFVECIAGCRQRLVVPSEAPAPAPAVVTAPVVAETAPEPADTVKTEKPHPVKKVTKKEAVAKKPVTQKSPLKKKGR